MRKPKKQTVLIIATVVMAALTTAVVVIPRLPKKTSTPPETITHSTDTPDENKANAENYNWRGAGDEPKKLTINKIGVDAYVQRMGVDQNQQIAVPTNVHLTGWFVDSVKPGQDGLAIIAGHVSGRTTNGVFEHLKDLNKGDSFQVELGNGTKLTYTVVNKTQVKSDQAASALFSQEPNVKSQLNLVTCGGNFDKTTNQYQDRIIVAGELQTL